jgi:tRNA(fMet)-specific endonuclease VapC
LKVLDTDVCIEILRGNQRVLEARRQTQVQVATTWITACELCFGAASSRAPDRNQALVGELLASLPILGLNLAASQHYGHQKARLRQAGQAPADADLLIAAIALAHGAALVAGNRRHFERIDGLRVEDWIR